MKSFNMKNQNGPEEVILERFDENNKLILLTVIDSEENPSTVSLTRDELVELEEALKTFRKLIDSEAQ
jgi:hypothetical protein